MFSVEKTPLDPDVDVMFRRFQVMQVNLSKICDSMNSLVQPNPNLRMEKLVLSKVIAHFANHSNSYFILDFTD